MAGLPKVYAKMGFKKGWAEFKRKRAAGKAHKRIVRSQASAKPPAGVVMAKKRKGGGMKISKERLAELKGKASKAMARARAGGAATFRNHGEAIQAIGLGAGGAIASSYAIGMIPVPAALPRPDVVKSGVQCVAGVVLSMQKQKQLKYAGYGMAVVGLLGVARGLFSVPTFAGEVDAGMYGELFQGEEEFMGEVLQGDSAPMGGTFSYV